MRPTAIFRPILGTRTIIFMLILGTMKIISGISVSCPISPSTVEIVGGCPDSKEKWRLAAARKNCTAIASQCDEPDKLVYHCVINEYANKTLEVCAYWKIIVLGHCTEYNLNGNRIQQNYRTNCFQFSSNPCPSLYFSYEAYKYKECYDFTTQMTKKPVTEYTQIQVASYRNGSKNDPNETKSTSPAVEKLPSKPLLTVFGLTAFVFVTAAIAASILFSTRMYLQKKETQAKKIIDEDIPIREGSSLKYCEIDKDEVNKIEDEQVLDAILGVNVSLRIGVMQNIGDKTEQVT